MKKLLLSVHIAIISTVAVIAQEKTLPRSEFAVELSSPVLDIKPGETKEITVSLLRSKAYAKSKAKLTLSSSLPEGVSVTFEPSEGALEASKATVAVTKNAKPGNYLLIVNGEMQNKRKGATLKLRIDQSGDSVSSRN